MGVKICPRCGNEVDESSPTCPFCGYSFIEEDDTAKVKMSVSAEFEEAVPIMEKIGDKYELISLIGKGGFSKVFLVRDKLLDRKCALKVLSPRVLTDAEMLERFRREAKIYASLEHPNIVPIYEVGIYRNIAYILMKYIEGITLKDYIKKYMENHGRPLPIDEIAKISRDVLSALHYMHSKGIIHRDIKPANVIIENQTGRAILADFGLAKRLDESGSLTRSGEMLGTPYYVSPEQAKGEKTTPQSDIYSFGITLFEMATGKVPFLGETPFQILMKHVREPLPSPSKYNPEICPELERIILKATDKKPKNRYRSALEMLRDIEKLSLRAKGMGVYSSRSKLFSFKNLILILLVLGIALAGYNYRKEIKTLPSRAITWIKGKISGGKKGSPPAAKPLTGQPKISFTLFSDLPAEVYDGKKLLGHTPLQISRKPGTYTFKFVSRAGVRWKKVKVHQNMSRVGVIFKTVTIGKIDSRPTAEVYLDGRLLGPTPVKNLRMTPGKHTIKVVRKGYKSAVKNLNLRDGQRIENLFFELKRVAKGE